MISMQWWRNSLFSSNVVLRDIYIDNRLIRKEGHRYLIIYGIPLLPMLEKKQTNLRICSFQFWVIYFVLVIMNDMFWVCSCYFLDSFSVWTDLELKAIRKLPNQPWLCWNLLSKESRPQCMHNIKIRISIKERSNEVIQVTYSAPA